MNIFLIGPMGAGKSTIGKKLSVLLDMPFLDSDQIIAARHGLSITDIFKLFGVSYFRQQEALVISDLLRNNNTIVATGGGVVLSEEIRIAMFKLAFVCYLRVSPQQQMSRCLESDSRPMLPKDKAAYLDFFKNMYAQRAHFYESSAHLIVDTDNLNINTIVSSIVSKIKAHNENNQ